MINNIIFDWSGVIKDSIEDHLSVVNKIFTEFGAKKISLTELKENWTQPYMLFCNKYLPDLTIEQEVVAYKEAILKNPSPRFYSGIVDLIKDLQRQGVRMVVVSSDLPETLLLEIDSFGLNNVFLDVVTGVHDKTIAMKNLIEKHDFNKSETFVVGDSNHEIEVGKHIGIKTVAVTWGLTSEDRLINFNPDFIAHDLDELRKFCNQ